MGNPAWGHGYHKGFGDGAKQGGAVGALITLGATGLVVGGKWAVGKLRERSVAKQLAENPSVDTPDADEKDSQASSSD
ncbi:hypothetical protein [Curtobacterium sp. CFBP9011]|uniref:hypothetical protein n=1 Tax=Curtobacterium sp. CFBP9011 TaxID=3096530 RepID=UPI002A6B8F2C|nr:hypothetical protein [Curtobacterium sp. CFBP9011]MDY1006336.1 hypothetical protein [Curtobacterium sp. CFBP9011]